MALFYFDLDDNGMVFPDDQGTECQDVAAVRYEAIRSLADITRDALPDGDHHKVESLERRRPNSRRANHRPFIGIFNFAKMPGIKI
ncbi:DUF6894 family protein [Mesorhizobium sophorae]|uniref:DUF6894 family protein n=1 Tax=Mesorhizobium sophorae TaxID=1300294 RepID=UPI000BA43A13